MLIALVTALGAQSAQAAEVTCGNGNLPTQALGSDPPDLRVTGICNVPLGADKNYYYGQVNILSGGELRFRESNNPQNSKTDFWANSIVIENGGMMTADGGPGGQTTILPFGTYGGVLTIHLYGKDESEWVHLDFKTQNLGAVCKTEQNDNVAPCGIPMNIWASNGRPIDGNNPPVLPGDVPDYFYQYGPLRGDGRCTDGSIANNGNCASIGAKVGYFGKKVLAVSYGGTLNLAGYKGATYEGDKDSDPLNSGTSWMRLADGHSLEKSNTSLMLERDPSGRWSAGDEIVVTTTDYLPGHSEKLTIQPTYNGGVTIPFKEPIQWPHNGVRYGGPADAGKQWKTRMVDRLKTSLGDDFVNNGAETRAAVALLSRSIRIVSAGDVVGADFGHRARGDQPDPQYAYGAHMVIRQGFKSVQIQGVEFAQMGQGGRLGHYPVHFHMARRTPANTYVKDSSVNESMTRWVVLHSTLGVRLARNVGYLSIGHGYYLEDGTETDNKLHSNIGIFARASIANAQNPRMIPGILSDNTDPATFKPPNVANQGFPYRSDAEYPSVFWITNGWNDFIGNMAAGAGTCGATYWFVPAANMNMTEIWNGGGSEVMKWSGYSALQKDRSYAGTTPLRSFYKNYATSAMHSFQTTADAPDCSGVIAADAQPGDFPVVKAVRSLAPLPIRHDVAGHSEPDNYSDHYYPHVLGGARRATVCPLGPNGYDCSTVPVCNNGAALQQCAVTVLDHYTSSFHWANGNVSAVWLRPQWYLLTSSVLSDVQNGGLSFITGGDYTHSSIIQGYWALVRNSVFIGNTRDNTKYPYASNIGPFNASSALKCEPQLAGKGVPPYCLSVAEGISMPTTGFFTNQRLNNIYDGPTYQDSNAYFDITTADCPVAGYNGGCIYGSGIAFLLLKKNPADVGSSCYLPNAAIGWKQPNGFYYPPAFHSRNLFFDTVDLRHYVIDPLFQENTYMTDSAAAKQQYCTGSPDFFNNWTSIDRQTELNDDDGTLTGLGNSLPAGPLNQTISVNEDSFFNAPVETAECASSLGDNSDAKNACALPVATKPPVTAKTSPYDYVTTVIYHKSADPSVDLWGSDCSNPGCYGVPLYRQYLTGNSNKAVATREWKRWYDNRCDQDRTTPACRWPFIRMSGSDTSQRQTMTINNGLYYLDTTVSGDVQKNEPFTTIPAAGRSLNVFNAGQTYYMFFVYAKQSTVQTYQIYVGKTFNKATQFQPVRVNIDTKDLRFTPAGGATPWVQTDYAANQGILTVTVDFSSETTLEPTPANGLCHPRTFCTPQGNSCVSALQDGSPFLVANPKLKGESDAVCKAWAVKDLDCPPAGCFGFSFTLPPDFAVGAYARPAPQSFPTGPDPNKKQGKPDWGTKFLRTTTSPDGQGGRCYYSTVPGTDCAVP